MPASIDGRIAQVLDTLEARLSEPLQVRDLAASVYLSPSRFAHLFQRAVGVPPLRYIQNRRLELARRLLVETTLAVNEIMRRSGWKDPSHFSKEFRRRFGMSPRNFRRDSNHAPAQVDEAIE